MKLCSASPTSHNLNIKMYSFRELLALFHLSSNITEEELKRAKIMVLKMHPDKSRLPPDYFLFYKKAFDMIVQYYQETAKVTAEVPTTEQVYSAESADKTTARAVQKTIKDMGVESFQRKFNELYESIAEKPKENVNEWFQQNDPLFQFDDVTNTAGLGAAIDHVKQKTSALAKYNGVQTMNSGGPAYNHLYDNDEESYVSCDPFGKLKYDDLRKVHKDQTVLAVSERDFEKMQHFSSMDHLQRERGSLQVQHVDRSEHERFFAEQQQVMKEKISAKQYAAQLKSMEYAEKNKQVMATFLHLK
jgi:hypothetical protein